MDRAWMIKPWTMHWALRDQHLLQRGPLGHGAEGCEPGTKADPAEPLTWSPAVQFHNTESGCQG